MSDPNGNRPDIDTLRRQLQTLWTAIDRIHSMVREKEKSGFELTNTEMYIRDLTVETMKAVNYPGEPPEVANEQENEKPASEFTQELAQLKAKLDALKQPPATDDETRDPGEPSVAADDDDIDMYGQTDTAAE